MIDSRGFSREEAEQLDELRNCLGNLQLLRKGENRKKSDKLPAEWLSTRTDEYLERHYIPKDEQLYQLENAKAFFDKREELIKENLMSKSPDREEVSPNPVEAISND